MLTPGIHSNHVAPSDAHHLSSLQLVLFMVEQNLLHMQMSGKRVAGEGVELIILIPIFQLLLLPTIRVAPLECAEQRSQHPQTWGLASPKAVTEKGEVEKVLQRKKSRLGQWGPTKIIHTSYHLQYNERAFGILEQGFN